jgi:O-acetyl-ADP-ribose deacetylase (regulator of RNase III)
MSITYVTGDATDPQGDGVKIIAHIVNDEGKWGRGFVVALSHRDRIPEDMYRAWHLDGKFLQRGHLRPFALGQMQLAPYIPSDPHLWVANMIAQHGVRHDPGLPRAVDYIALRICLHQLADIAEDMHASVHMPRIGCGLGGGTWDEIEPIIHDTLTKRDISVTVYDLKGA